MDEAKLTQLLGPESAQLAVETVRVWQTVDETHVVIDRERLKRLLYIAETAADIGKRAVASEPPDYGHAKWTLTLTSEECHFLASAFEHLKPGDLDPIP